MAESQVDCDLTIVEILRDGGLKTQEGAAFIAEHISREDRWALCAALEQWEKGEKDRIAHLTELIENVEQARDDFRASRNESQVA